MTKKLPLSDKDIFDLLDKSKKEYEEYLSIVEFNQFSVFGEQQSVENSLWEQKGWDLPLDFCFYKEGKDAIME